MRFHLPAGRIMAVAGVLLIGGSTLLAAEGKRDKKPLAGPDQKAPTTQPGGRTMSGEGRGNGERGREIIEKAMAGVNPTDEQKAKIKTILEDGKAKRDAFMAQHAEELKALGEQARAAREAKDDAKLKELNEKRMAIMATGPKRGEVLDNVRNVLSDEQRKTFDANTAEIKENFEKNHPRAANMMGENRRGGDKAPGERKKNKEGGGDKNKLDI